MDQFGAETSDAFEDLVQDCYHRLIEPPGSNLDDPDRGLGIEDALSGPLDPTLTTRIERELEKDERVERVSASITEIEAGGFSVEVSIVADEKELGLVLESDASGVVRRVL